MQNIEKRISVRGYDPAPLGETELSVLRQAALAAPSGRNLQPLHFTFTQDAALKKRLSDLVDPAGDVFYGAPLVIMISGDRNAKWSHIDAGIAVQTIALAAESIGLGSVIIGCVDAAFIGPHGERLAKEWHFPAGYRYEIGIAVGRPAATKEPHDRRPENIEVI